MNEKEIIEKIRELRETLGIATGIAHELADLLDGQDKFKVVIRMPKNGQINNIDLEVIAGCWIHAVKTINIDLEKEE